jgi:beta-glucosidase
VRELKGFERVTLNPGETRRVAFTLTEEALAFTRADGTKGIEPGNFHVWIAPNSQSGLQDGFRL